jgi:acyl carrier protein
MRLEPFSHPSFSAEQRVREKMARDFGLDADAIIPGFPLSDWLVENSLDMIELAVWVEMELGIEIDDEALGRIRTFGDLVRAVDAALAARTSN